ncbi:tRNA1(Val) (adenine(37)-N6)-methyltransferase [compost metagenome]
MSVFKFKHFHIHQANAALKVGTDSMILGSLCNWENPKHLLDIGTGTGVLALMCAQRFSFETITGLEISEEAFTDAQTNAANNPFAPRVSMIRQAVQDYYPETPFDAIISNPPFFENSSKNPDEHKSLARHTESLSFTELIAAISRLLSDEGKAWIILPVESQDSIIQLGQTHQLFVSDLITLFGKPERATRIILSFTKSQTALLQSSFCIRNENGTYTAEYKELTREFHDREL